MSDGILEMEFDENSILTCLHTYLQKCYNNISNKFVHVFITLYLKSPILTKIISTCLKGFLRFGTVYVYVIVRKNIYLVVKLSGQLQAIDGPQNFTSISADRPRMKRHHFQNLVRINDEKSTARVRNSRKIVAIRRFY